MNNVLTNIVAFSAVQRLLNSPEWDKLKLIAIDYDGVVAHTEPHQMLAFIHTAKKHGTVLPEQGINFAEFVKEMIGKPEEVILSRLKNRHEIPHSIDFLLSERAEAYLAAARELLLPNPYALKVIKAANECGKRCIILSNGRSNVLSALNDHWGIGGHFSEMQTIDKREIANKADYLLDRATRDSISPDRILLLEDSAKTISDSEGKLIAGKRINAVYFQHDLNDTLFTPDTTKTVLPCINPMEQMGINARQNLHRQIGFARTNLKNVAGV